MADQNFMKKWAEQRGLAIRGLTDGNGGKPPEDEGSWFDWFSDLDLGDIDWKALMELLEVIIEAIQKALQSGD